MAAVYSVCFIRRGGSTGTNDFAVPAGFVAVVRDIDAVTNSGPGSAVVQVEETPTGIPFWFVSDSSGNIVWHQWSGRQVLNVGSTLRVAVSGGGNANVSVSGYLLAA